MEVNGVAKFNDASVPPIKYTSLSTDAAPNHARPRLRFSDCVDHDPDGTTAVEFVYDVKSKDSTSVVGGQILFVLVYPPITHNVDAPEASC